MISQDIRQRGEATEKGKFILLFLSMTAISVVVLSVFHPVERGWWIFKYTEYPVQFLGSVAFIIGSVYVLFLTKWYRPDNNTFDFNTAILAFCGCGLISILLAVFLGYPLWNIIGFREVETGWWIFSNTEIQARDPIVEVLEVTGAIAGPVEELAKLVAVMAIPSVRRSLTTPKSALFHVSLCAFGFALIENVMYFCLAEDVIVLRANPAHAVFSAIWGFALGNWLSGNKSFSHFFQYLGLGMGLHATWNFFASIQSVVFFLVFALTSWKGLSFLKRELQSEELTRP